jgi:hypothetical protein
MHASSDHPESHAARATWTLFWFNVVVCVFTVCLGLYKTGNPSRYFGEGRFTTAISCLQLLAVAVFCALIFLQRNRVMRGRPGRLAVLVWAAIAAGFVFLTLDEALQFHEKLDKWILRTLSLENNQITDRLDDALIGFYGLCGLIVMWACRSEMLRFRSVMFKPLVLGFIALVLSVLGDTISNGDELLLAMTGDLALAKKLNGWFSVVDGAFTLIAEGFFVAAFFAGWKQARTLASSKLP